MEALVAAARAGDRTAELEVIRRFEPAVRGIARDYFLPGGDSDDLRQEARLGLLKAIRDFDAAAGVPFGAFATLCITRQVISAVKVATRQKHLVLTVAARGPVEVEHERLDILDTCEAPRTDPFGLLDDRRRARLVLSVVRDQLSPIERAAVIGRANGESCNEIAARLGLPIRTRTDRSRAGYTRCKAIDNALSRARAKIRRALAEDRPVVHVNPTTSPGATGGTTYSIVEEQAA